VVIRPRGIRAKIQIPIQRLWPQAESAHASRVDVFIERITQRFPGLLDQLVETAVDYRKGKAYVNMASIAVNGGIISSASSRLRHVGSSELLGLLIVGQQGRLVPAFVAERFPCVELGLVAADVRHALHTHLVNKL